MNESNTPERNLPITKARKEVDRDGRFIKYDNGIVYDSKTGLEWFTGQDVDRSWNEAKKWTEALDVDGNNWRMPTIKELYNIIVVAGLKKCYLRTRLLKTSGLWLWAHEAKGSKALGFHLHYCNHALRKISDNRSKRSFAVRSRN